MDFEIEQFKRDVDLVAFSVSKGYRVDRRESSQSSKVLRHDATGDKLIVSRAADGHWQYFSVRDREDNGTIIDFIQKREQKSLGEVRRELRGWTHTWPPQLPVRLPLLLTSPDRAAVALEVKRASMPETHPYLEYRGISRDTLSHPRFRGTWRRAAGSHGNVIFMHHDEQGLSGFEVKNHGFTGFSKGGRKGMWSSHTASGDRRLIVTESAIDALSYHQAQPHPNSRYVSFAGEQNPQQPILLDRAILEMRAGSRIVAATDNDKAGHDFAARIRDLSAKHAHVAFERHAPSLGKDWNDHLRAELARVGPVLSGPTSGKGLER